MSKKLEKLHGVFDKFWKYLYKSICSSQINDHRLYINLFVKMADILHIHMLTQNAHSIQSHIEAIE